MIDVSDCILRRQQVTTTRRKHYSFSECDTKRWKQTHAHTHQIKSTDCSIRKAWLIFGILLIGAPARSAGINLYFLCVNILICCQCIVLAPSPGGVVVAADRTWRCAGEARSPCWRYLALPLLLPALGCGHSPAVMSGSSRLGRPRLQLGLLHQYHCYQPSRSQVVGAVSCWAVARASPRSRAARRIESRSVKKLFRALAVVNC